MRRLGTLVFVACSARAPATVNVQPLPSPPPARVAERARESAIDIDFENVIHLVGVSFEPETAKAGEHVAISFRWRCDASPGDGWQVFTHVTDANAKSENLDYLGPLREPDASGRQRQGPDRWRAGVTYSETLDYAIPTWAKGKLIVYVGFWRGASRLHVVSGPNDGDNRGIAGSIALE